MLSLPFRRIGHVAGGTETFRGRPRPGTSSAFFSEQGEVRFWRTVRSALTSKPWVSQGLKDANMSHRSKTTIIELRVPRTKGSQDRFAVRAVSAALGGPSGGHGCPSRMATPNQRTAIRFPYRGRALPPRASLPNFWTKGAAGTVSPRN